MVLLGEFVLILEDGILATSTEEEVAICLNVLKWVGRCEDVLRCTCVWIKRKQR